MQIRVEHDLDDLANDLASIARQAPQDMIGVVREGIRTGNVVAKDFARRSSGRHGRHYPNAFSPEMHGAQASLGGNPQYSGEYGPDVAKPQGGMSFERGSRNQPAHLDLARSADLIGPSFAQEVSRLPGKWFW